MVPGLTNNGRTCRKLGVSSLVHPSVTASVLELSGACT